MVDREDLSSTALRVLGTRPDIAKLEAIDPTILKTGALVFVSSLRAFFVWVLDATDAPDGANVVSPSNGVGRWLRMPNGQVWQNQANWYVDAVNGSDSNTGATPATALQTMAELSMRIGSLSIEIDTTVHLLSDFPEDDAFVFKGVIRGNSVFRIIGEATTELLAPTALTGVVNFVLGTTRPTITIAGVNWATQGLVGKRCRVISSATAAVDTVFWVESVAGAADTVNISRPYLFSALGALQGTSQTLSVGDVIVVEELTQCGPLSLRWMDDGFSRTITQEVVLESIRTHSAVFGEFNFGVATGKTAPRSNGLIVWSEIRTTFPVLGSISVNACRFFNEHANHFVEGLGELRACSLVTPSVQFRGFSEFFLSQDCSGEACRVVCGSTQTQMEATMLTINQGLSLWGWTSDGIRTRYGGRILANGLVWGISAVAASYGIQCSSGGEFQYETTVKPTIVGAATPVKDVRIGGTDLAYAAVPAVNATNLARIVVRVE